MTPLQPKFITFDCYGSLRYLEMASVSRRAYGARLNPEAMDGFCEGIGSLAGSVGL